MDQMRNFDRGLAPIDSTSLLQNQIQDLSKMQNRMRQFDEKQKRVEYSSRNKINSARGGIRSEGGTLTSMPSHMSAGGAVSARGNRRQEQGQPGGQATHTGVKKDSKPLNTTSAA